MIIGVWCRAHYIPTVHLQDHFWSALLVQTRALDTELKVGHDGHAQWDDRKWDYRWLLSRNLRDFHPSFSEVVLGLELQTVMFQL